MLKLIAFGICLLFVAIDGQSTSDCGTTKGCYLNPKGCTDAKCEFIYKWQDAGDNTVFEITALLNVTQDQSWAAIGFGFNRSMGNDCVVMCQHDATQKTDTVQHFFAVAPGRPSVLDPNNPTVGLTSSSISVNNGFFTCKFTREKRQKTDRYYDLNNFWYVLGANGAIANKLIQFHGPSNTASATPVDFRSTNIFY